MSEYNESTNEQTKTENHADVGVDKTNKSGRLRDEKGHFLPSDGSKCNHEKKIKKENKEDPNVVKIKIVREKKPKTPKNIIGKLNEMKERNASRFIESVISNDPDRIDIDGKKYYSDKYVQLLKEDVEKAQNNEAEAIECMDEMEKSTKTMLDASKNILKDLSEKSVKYRMWKSLAIGLLTGFVLGFAISMAKVYVAELDRNTPTADLRPSAAR